MTAADRAILARWRARLAIRKGLLAAARRRHEWNPTPASRAVIDKRKEQVAYAERVIARRVTPTPAKPSMRDRAYAEAKKLIGVMEQGGNNRGRDVERIIASGGGRAGDAWCGWFVAHCYRLAGSKTIEWRWGAVRLISLVSGVRRTSKPKRGDLVRFTFDHVGMFVRDNGDGTITTIEGNTGRTGAVSDSRTGGDGVYLKVRPKSLVSDYLEVTR